MYGNLGTVGKAYGRFEAFGGMMTGLLFFILLIAGGAFLIKYARRYSGKVTGKIKKVECTTSRDSKGKPKRTCVADVEYMVPGESKTRMTSMEVMFGAYEGGTKTVRYDPRDPSDTMNGSVQPALVPIGIGLIVCAFCVCISGIVTFVVVMKSGTLAMGYGAVSALRSI